MNRKSNAEVPRPKDFGIASVDFVNISIAAGKLICCDDPQILFSIHGELSAICAFVEIELVVESCDPAVSPILYLDYGLGFSERSSIRMFRRDVAWIAFVPFPHLARRLRVDPFESAGTLRLASLGARGASAGALAQLLSQGSAEAAQANAARHASALVRFLRNSPAALTRGDGDDQVTIATLALECLHGPQTTDIVVDTDYSDWIARNERLNDADRAWMRAEQDRWAQRPLLSVVMPVYDPPISLLEEAIASLRAQSYEEWELCIADDASRDPEVRRCIARWAAADARIRPVYRKSNGHIVEATNSAAATARGDFLVLMDNDDLLPPHALWMVAHAIHHHPNAMMLFSDEDKLTAGGNRAYPYAKGSFDRFLMYGHNMFCHLGVYRRSLYEKIGGCRRDFEGSQDYDLVLRGLDEVGEDAIVHIPHVLYHWREIPGSTSMGPMHKNYAFDAAKRAINDHFERNAWPLMSVDGRYPGVAAVRTLSVPSPWIVSLIVILRSDDRALSSCLSDLRRLSDPLVEVVIIDNAPDTPEKHGVLAALSRESHRYRIIRDDGPFHFARLINLGAAAVRGEIVGVLGEDLTFSTPDPLERVRAWLCVADVGMVGGRVLQQDGSIRNFGIYIKGSAADPVRHAYAGLSDDEPQNFGKSHLLQQFTAVSAACAFVRTADFRALNGYDDYSTEEYAQIDFCLRLRARKLKVIGDPLIRLCVDEQRSLHRRAVCESPGEIASDKARLADRWGTKGLSDPFLSPNFPVNGLAYRLSPDAHRPPWKAP